MNLRHSPTLFGFWSAFSFPDKDSSVPEATTYDPLNKDLYQVADAELRARREDIAHSNLYYAGRHKQHLKVKPGTINHNITKNLFLQAVDRTKAFLIPAMPKLELDEMAETDDEEWLRRCWKAAGAAAILADLAHNGCMAGHIFAKILPPEEGQLYPQLLNLNPANALCWWHAENHTKVLWYELRYGTGKNEKRQDIVKTGSTWAIYEYKRKQDSSVVTGAAGWELSGEGEEWPYPLGPIVDWQHVRKPNFYYGESEAVDLDLNDGVNKVASNTSKILHHHAYPKTFLKGVKGGKVQETGIEGLLSVENEQADAKNIEMQSDLASSRNFTADLEDSYLAQRRIVVLKGAVADFQRVTNLGIQELYVDQNAKIRELHWNYDGGIEGISLRFLMLDGREYVDREVTAHWKEALPQDPTVQVAVLEKDRQMGLVSKETLSEERGYNYGEEQARIDEEGQDQASLLERILRENPMGNTGNNPPGQNQPPDGGNA